MLNESREHAPYLFAEGYFSVEAMLTEPAQSGAGRSHRTFAVNTAEHVGYLNMTGRVGYDSVYPNPHLRGTKVFSGRLETRRRPPVGAVARSKTDHNGEILATELTVRAAPLRSDQKTIDLRHPERLATVAAWNLGKLF